MRVQIEFFWAIEQDRTPFRRHNLNRTKLFGLAALTLSVGLSMVVATTSAQTSDKKPTDKKQAAPANGPKDPAVERARREVRLLDDIYKTAIVLITTHYVDDKDSLPAGSAFKALFETVAKKGWHEVRLLDATGDPYEPDNAPKDGFEKRAIAKLLAGQAAYDEVSNEGGKKYLLAATAIPVVMEKCTLCHSNYKDVPAGKAIGAIGYKIPILD